MPTRCNRGFYCRSYCLLNMFRAPLCPSSGAQEYYTVVAACSISCCGFEVAGLVWSWVFCVRFAGCCFFLLQILLLAQHVSGTTMPIIRSSRVLYIGCCLWYLVLWFSSCWSGVELRVMCPFCRMLLFYCRSYSLLNMFRPTLCPSSGAQEYYTVVAACGISCCGFQVVGFVWSSGAPCKPDTYPSAPHQTSNLKTTERNTTGSNHCIILLSSWWWA